MQTSRNGGHKARDFQHRKVFRPPGVGPSTLLSTSEVINRDCNPNSNPSSKGCVGESLLISVKHSCTTAFHKPAKCFQKYLPKDTFATLDVEKDVRLLELVSVSDCRGRQPRHVLK